MTSSGSGGDPAEFDFDFNLASEVANPDTASQEEFLKLQLRRQGAMDHAGNWKFTHPVVDKAQEELKKQAIARAVSLLDSKKHDGPHKYMWAIRGIPMGKGMPSMNLPPEAQNAIAQHLEDCGFVHDPDRQKIKHVAPAMGPDISINPGTWVSVDAPDPVTGTPSPELDEIDLTGTHPDQLRAMELAIYNERIRVLKKQHEDFPHNVDETPSVVQQLNAVPIGELGQ